MTNHCADDGPRATSAWIPPQLRDPELAHAVPDWMHCGSFRIEGRLGPTRGRLEANTERIAPLPGFIIAGTTGKGNRRNTGLPAVNLPRPQCSVQAAVGKKRIVGTGFGDVAVVDHE